jgi:dinuclear metal center YbgI/SA1388 family protein
MITIRDIYSKIDEFSPFASQDSFDNSGLIIGGFDDVVHKALICLDITQFEIQKATEIGTNLIVSHHPVIFSPVKKIEADSPVAMLLQNGINVISAHTNADIHFLTCALLRVLGLESSAEVLAPINADGTGYGKIVPFGGTSEELIEICGKAGEVTANNCNPDQLLKVAVCPGSGNAVFPSVLRKNCDAFVTGELKHDLFVTAAHLGKPLIITIEHFYSELPFCDYLAAELRRAFADLEVVPFAHNFYRQTQS